MTVTFGSYSFDHAAYDEVGDVLYLRQGDRREPPTTLSTPEGHAVSFDELGEVIGMTIVNARWLLERDGKVAVTVPLRIETAADELRSVLASASG